MKQKAFDDVVELLNATTGGKAQITLRDIEEASLREFGDLAFACFRLPKIFQKDPTTIAKNLSELINEQLSQVKKKTLIDRVEARGAYLNFFLKTSRFAELLFKRIDKEKDTFGETDLLAGQKIVVEYASPNTNKPLTLGHIRNIALGWSLAELLKTQGAKVFKTEIRNDRGAAMCKTMIAWERWGEGKTPKSEKKKGDHFVGEYYVLFSQKAEEDPTLKEEIQTCLKRWEEKDAPTRKLWKKMRDWVMDGIEETYKTLGADFDKHFYESEIYDKGVEIVKKGLTEGKFIKDEKGNIIAPLEKDYNLPNSVVLRADGTSVYITQDLYLAEAKYKEWKYDRSLYVVGMEQNLQFQKLFATFDLLGLPWAKKSFHVSYGWVNLPEGRMKSRTGYVVDADDLVLELQNLAKEEIQERDEKLTTKELETRSLEIALAAIKYYILQVDPKTTIVFDPKKSIALQGRTGPYLQYMAVRIQSILKKAPRNFLHGEIFPSHFTTPEEHELIMLLGDFPDILVQAAHDYNPSTLAKYLYELARAFSIFYEKHQVIDEENEERSRARIRLSQNTLLVLNKGLNLLGIRAPKRM